jgi:hypothetical protein
MMGWNVNNLTLPEGENMPQGERIVARFDLMLPNVILQGCCLLHREGKGWTIWGPSASVKLKTKLRREIKRHLNGQYGLGPGGA